MHKPNVNFLKKKSKKAEEEYKIYKNIFEKTKKSAKRNFYSKKIEEHKNNSKETWKIMKELSGKTKVKTKNLPKMLQTNNGQSYDTTEIAKEFNIFFTNVGPNLASKIPTTNQSFKHYLKKNENSIENNELSFDEFEKAFQSLKRNKAAGYDDIDGNIVIDSFEYIKNPLFKVFHKSFQEGVFPEKLKIAKVTPIFKSGLNSIPGNYRPISVLSIFSKILERITYNRIYSFFSTNNLFFNKQFGFQKSTSTEHAIIQLVDDITKAFSKNEYTLGVFIDLSKAFDTVDHNILLKKLENYGIRDCLLKWLKSYLSSRFQFVNIENNIDKSLENVLKIICGVPQGSILGPLLFLIYVNDLCKSSKKLSAIMFADDSNLFYSDTSLDNLFFTMNEELKNISLWFKANKLSLNVSKTKFSLFHPAAKKRLMPDQLPCLNIDNIEIQRDPVTKFLGVMIDENLSWKPHICNVSSKIAKSIGILYKTRDILNKKLLTQLYFSFIHSYLNYGNIAWASTHKSKLSVLYRRQKHALRVINFQDRYTHTKPFFDEMNILNVYELNVYNILLFLIKCKLLTAPSIFHPIYTLKPPNKYNMRSKGVLIEPVCKTKQSSFRISFRAPNMWNKLIVPKLTSLRIDSLNLFSIDLKNLLKEFANKNNIEELF